MTNIKVNFDRIVSDMKPMHAVNNGPVHKFAADQRISNLEYYAAAGIPFARTHDAAFFATYGGEHTVDVHAVFPDFDKDPHDPASYDFQLTDEYLKTIKAAGTEPFFRLGSKIEHTSKKYGTLPPKDFKKWAVICEHIIRHYTEDFADGLNMKITYWEIWNEPDLDPDDSTHKRCWGGTKKQFFEFYDIAATHLKKCFPHLKIGGPASSNLNGPWVREFLSELKAPLDFFSWHVYSNDPYKIAELCTYARNLLDEYGFKDTESILNEWNYVKGWHNDDWVYSLKSEKSLKGAAFTAQTMSLCQNEPLDLLMYYDARPCAMNGLFCTDIPNERLKGYYPFVIFNTLYKLGKNVHSESDTREISVCAATDSKDYAVMLTYYDDNDGAGEKKCEINLSGFGEVSCFEIEYYLLDDKHDLELVRRERFTSRNFTAFLTLTLNSSYLIKIKPVD